MTAYIHGIGTALPPHVYTQDYARDRMMGFLPGHRNQRMIRGIYDRSGISRRYSVLPDFVAGEEPLLFRQSSTGRMGEPSTGARNKIYAEWAGKLGVQASRALLDSLPWLRPDEITHVITVSCTGFCNPGPDLELIRELGLCVGVERYNIGFMGCYGAFPALRMAEQFCRANPESAVLVVSMELCSLHLQFREETDSLVANSLFADGAAAALVSARPPQGDGVAYALQGFSTDIATEGSSDMAWTIGDHGFDIRLSTYVPDVIGGHVESIVTRTLTRKGWCRDDIGIWAIHPGGRAILDRVQEELELAPEQTVDARAVLRDYGNMSSATILFVLDRIRSLRGAYEQRPVYAMGFGPGLTIETAMLEPIISSSAHILPLETPHELGVPV